MSRLFIEGDYARDLLAQPNALRAASRSILAALAGPLAPVVSAWRAGHYRRVVLTGMGSSLHALYPLHLGLSQLERPCHWLETAELLAGFASLHSPDTLLITVSQSGESAEIVTLLTRESKFGHVIGITNQPASTLGRLAGTTLALNAGPEATVSCKTYLATLAVLHGLECALTGESLDALPARLELAAAATATYLGSWRQHLEQLAPWAEFTDCTFVTGRGRSLATAGTAGLILKESTRSPAEGMSCAAFRHGPLEVVGPTILVAILAGDDQSRPLNRRLHEDICRSGGRSVWIDEREATADAFRLPAVPATLRPIVEILPLQMFSLALAARDGIEGGRFTRATKITVIA